MERQKELTVKIKETEDKTIIVETINNIKRKLKCTKEQEAELRFLWSIVQTECVFNLLNVSENEDNSISAELIIFEPEYLIDISSLAECFKPYGNHPLNYILSRFRPQENTKHILLGNAANFFMDELINEKEDEPLTYIHTLKKLFKSSPFEFTACENLKNKEEERLFFNSCEHQFRNIKKTINQLFTSANIDKNKTVIEPSYICSELGLQGRLDLIQQDFSALVELKSGKGIEDFRTGSFQHSALNHYTQMALYLAILEYTMNIEHKFIRSYLLYSKYPVLSNENCTNSILNSILNVRNLIVALDFNIQNSNNNKNTLDLIQSIQSDVLNTKKLSGSFFDNYLRQPIDRFQVKIQSLTELEKVYFSRIYTFIVKELWLFKVGERDYEGTKRSSNLWNASMEDKIATGELLYDLTIAEYSDEHTVELKIPPYESDYLPNFRQGDAVVLYERKSVKDNVNNKQVFKGAIEMIDARSVKIRLRARQRNLIVLPEGNLYALEHDYIDSTYNSMFRALTAFVEAPKERRDLLLAQRMPRFNDQKNINVEQSCNKIELIVRKAMTAQDCFLLVGPPGTGKTSIALKRMVELSLENEMENILLLSYTNRAVDEICKSLESINKPVNYIRIGNELNCAAPYRSRLLDKQLKNCNRRDEVRSIIEHCKVFVGTVASVWNKPDLFKLKQFQTAFIDEASQLLEPHLLGILCTKNNLEEPAVDRFIMIGDHKQLPAIVLQSKEECHVEDVLLQQVGLSDLSESLFERLYKKYKKINLLSAFDTLTMQGRMHPDISAFPSQYFYANLLESAGLAHQNETSKNVYLNRNGKWNDLVENQRIVFISHSGSLKNNNSKINTNEVRIITDIVVALTNRLKKNNEPFHCDTLGIITPYRNQLALIKKALEKTGIAELTENVLIDTIERFQGSQKDVIIYSFCVSDEAQLRNLPNLMEDDGIEVDRKLNVALTRARKQLFITGHASLLTKNKLYSKLINHIKSNGVFVDV